MANKKANLKQVDLERCAKAMRKAGVDEWRVDVFPDGKYSIVAGRGQDQAQPSGWEDLE